MTARTAFSPRTSSPANRFTDSLDRRPPIRVTVVSVAREVWGSETSVLGLIPLLHQRRIEVTIAAPLGDFTAAARDVGAAVVRFDPPRHGGLVAAAPSRTSTLANVAREMPRSLGGVRAVLSATAGADVVHCNSLLATVDCVLGGRARRRPTVLELHDLVRPGPSRWLLSACLRGASAGIAISTPVATNVERWAASRVTLIGQAVDVARFRPGQAVPTLRAQLTARPQEPLVAVIGRIDPAKAVDRVVAAVAKLNDAGVRCGLVVVGTPSSGNAHYASDLQARAQQRLGERVRFVGTRDDIPAVLRAVDVLVNAADAEPFGLSVLEAQACGVCVVTSNTGGLTDFVLDGVTGRTVDPAIPAQLVDALGDVVRSADLRAELAATARARAVQFHSIDARADRLASLYRGLARRSQVSG